MTLKEFAIELPAIRDEAKALWGLQLVCSECERFHINYSNCDYGSWPSSAITITELHLIKMIESNDPIKYLKDYRGDKLL